MTHHCVDRGNMICSYLCLFRHKVDENSKGREVLVLLLAFQLLDHLSNNHLGNFVWSLQFSWSSFKIVRLSIFVRAIIRNPILLQEIHQLWKLFAISRWFARPYVQLITEGTSNHECVPKSLFQQVHSFLKYFTWVQEKEPLNTRRCISSQIMLAVVDVLTFWHSFLWNESFKT